MPLTLISHHVLRRAGSLCRLQHSDGLCLRSACSYPAMGIRPGSDSTNTALFPSAGRGSVSISLIYMFY